MEHVCDRSMTALRRGNHDEAMKIINDSTPKLENSAIFHHVAGIISVTVAGSIDDPNLKQRHLKNALDSAKKAKSLSPNSIVYSHCYAKLLFEVSLDEDENRQNKEVIAECERALVLENPNDPADDNRDETVSFSEETKEARVSKVKLEIRKLIENVNVADLVSWVRKHDDGLRYRLVSFEAVSVEKAVEASKMKEVEDTVAAAARLLLLQDLKKQSDE